MIVFVDGRRLASKPLRGRRFSLRVSLPTGDVTVRVTTIGSGGRRSSNVVGDVFGLPAASRPRVVRARQDSVLAQKLRTLDREFKGTTGFYVQSLTGGAGAAWNAKARFPAASTLKLAIAATVLAEHSGIPPPGSHLDALLREMLIPSDDAAANSLLVWLGGSTSSGAYHVNDLMRSIGLTDTLMYGGYLTRTLSDSIPVRVDERPAFGVGKYTTAWDMTRLWRALWLASGGKGRLRSSQRGLTPADARYLLWLLAHVRDTPKLDTSLRNRAGRRRPSQGGMDLDRPPRHRPRLLERWGLRRRSDDLETVRRRRLRGSPCRARRADHARAFAPSKGDSRIGLDAALVLVGTVSEPTTASVRKREP